MKETDKYTSYALWNNVVFMFLKWTLLRVAKLGTANFSVHMYAHYRHTLGFKKVSIYLYFLRKSTYVNHAINMRRRQLNACERL